MPSMLPDMYGLFAFQPLYNLYLHTSRIPTKAMIAELEFRLKLTRLGHSPKMLKLFIQIRKSFICWCNTSVAGFGK